MASRRVLSAIERHGAGDGRGEGSVLTEVMTAQQLAALLQMPVSTIEDYARRQVLPSVKLGRHRRFIRSEIEDALSLR